MNLFGRKKKDGGGAPPVRRAGDADPSSAILRIRETVETLEKRDAHLAKKEKALLLEAKQLAAAKDKKRAMIALKKKKTYEKERSKISGMILSLEQQSIALEGSKTNFDTYWTMKAGADEMKKVRQNLDVDDVEEVMDNIQEEMDTMDQISDAISRPAADLFEDDELLAELQELEEQDLEEQLLQSPSVPTKVVAEARLPDMPTVPSGAVASANVEEEEDEDAKALRELQAEMAL